MGCTQQTGQVVLTNSNKQMHVCSTGDVVSNPALCPTVTAQQTEEPKVGNDGALTETPQSEFKVSEVLDGDSIVLENGSEVRLIGINASEAGQQCYSEAKSKLEELVKGKTVRLEKDISNKDQYERQLRYVYVGNVFVNKEMVRLGYATAYEYPPDTKYSPQIAQAEKEAKQNKGCLWQTSEANYIKDKCIQIMNFHFNASGNDNYNLNDEYVSFKNACAYPIEMSGWSIKDEATNTYTFPSFILKPNSIFTLYTGSGTNTETQLFWRRSGYAVWNNTGDTMYVRNSSGGLVLNYSYAGYD
ncbi:MAG: lamin tail domain-containing protein [Candidatus Diapherotrites archaeon]